MALPALAHPIVQAPIGACAGPELVAAVAEAGGLGLLACTWSEPDAITADVAAVRSGTVGVFGGNLVLRFPVEDQLGALLDAAAPVITFSWGQPGPARVARCHAAGSVVLVQVGTASAVSEAVADGADGIIVQGVEAGGHVQATQPLERLLDDVLAEAGPVPVIAAGGLATSVDVARVLAAGAEAAMLGTRFVATLESRAHPRYKQRLVEAASADAALTLVFDGAWPFGPHRVLRSPTVDTWEAAGCPWPGDRPGEGDVVLERPDGRRIPRYDDAPPIAGDAGDVDAACLYAGAGVGDIDDLPPAAEVLVRLASTAQ